MTSLPTTGPVDVAATGRRPADAADEEPVYFGPDDDLFGILTRPTGPARGVGVALVNWGAWEPAGPNRLWTRLARRLAAEGFHCLRYNGTGVGESRGRVSGFHARHPHADEARAAFDLLRAQGVERLASVGYCIGGRAGLAVSAAPDLAALAVVGMPVLDFPQDHRRQAVPATGHLLALVHQLRRHPLTTARGRARVVTHLKLAAGALRRHRGRPPSAGRGRHRWVAPGVAGPLDDLARRRVPVLVVYGDEDKYLDDWRLARLGGLRRATRAGSTVELRVVGGQVHPFEATDVEDRALDAVVTWLSAVAPAATARRPGAVAP